VGATNQTIRHGWRWGTALLIGAVSLATTLGRARTEPAMAAAPVAETVFNFTGREQVYAIPDVGANTLAIVAAGGDGQAATSHPGPIYLGGRGAQVRAFLPLPPELRTLYVEVGVNGGFMRDTGVGRFNGAGAGGAATHGAPIGGDGGGASDVRTCSRHNPLCLIGGRFVPSIESRLVVAGGGGGAVAGFPGFAGGNAGIGQDGGAGLPAQQQGTDGQGGGGGTLGRCCAAGGNGGQARDAGATSGAAGGPGVLGQGGRGGDGGIGTPQSGGGLQGDGGSGGGGGGGYVGGAGGGGGAGNVLAPHYRGGSGGGGSSWVTPAAFGTAMALNNTGTFVRVAPATTTTTTVTCPHTAPQGSPVTCTARVQNVSTRFPSAPTGSVSWALTAGTGIVSPTTCDLDAAASCTVRFTPSTAPGSTATIKASYASADAFHVGSQGTTQVTVRAPRADLSLSQALSPTSTAGQLRNVITITNHGPATATDLRVRDLVISPSVRQVTVTTNQPGAECQLIRPPAGSDRALRCTLSSLAANGVWTLRVTYTGASGGRIDSTAEVLAGAGTTDPTPGDIRSTVSGTYP
jgi:hypothetical protein